MKRILSFAASAALLLGFVSCEQQPVPGEIPMGGGNSLKTITLSLAGADTRSTTAADEFLIGEATVFVYQSGPSGETLYKTVLTTSSTVGVDLLFTDAVDYTYRFEAYANMGELTEAPSEVSFEDESSEGFQMHGSLSGVDASSAGSATVMLDRYVGRVVVGSVKLQWKEQANASQEFTLKRMWLANAAAVSGGEAVYNVDGAYSASVMDALLVSEVNQVIADGGTYDVPHYLYAYASGSTALVLECDWAGETMYYHVDYEPVANSSMTYTLSIHQTGSSEPLGDVTDDALVAAGALQANDWNSQESEKHFGEEKILPYFYIEALEDNTEISLSLKTIQYSLDGKEWTELPQRVKTPAINAGEKIYFKAENLTISDSGLGNFYVSKKFNVGGNIMSLLFGDDFVDKTDLTGYNHVFTNLFYENSNLISAKELVLPATTLADYCYSAMFSECTSLTQAPELPATTLADYCYWNMFYGCTSLTKTPDLFAITLETYCYSSMFSGCTNLEATSELPATTLVRDCYSSMFRGCTSLKEPPELPATTLAVNCYGNMFSGCTSLKEAPELPATTLADDCYQNMFGGCSSLTEAPELPATILANYCYKYMFSRCTNLITVPELPAKTLKQECYQEMFKGCTSLTEVPELPATTLARYCYYGMFEGCTSLDKAPELPATTAIEQCYTSMFKGCTSLTEAPELPATRLAGSCYLSMFEGCTSLDKAPELPAITAEQYCYKGMFSGCTSLTEAPELPATTLSGGCYESMFEGCASLVNAPELPAMSALRECYISMFKGCISLVNAPDLPATKLITGCYMSMFDGCTSLSEAPELPATTLAYNCYNGMFKGCIDLAEAPELPATTLASGCYGNMFQDCSSLSYIKMLATDISATNCLTNWVSGVSATGTFVKSADATWDVTGVSGVPEGWNVVVDTPVGAFVYDVNGDFYTASEWTASGNDNSTAVGVAVTDGEHSFVIHPTESTEKLVWASASALIDGVFASEDQATAVTDFAGEANTAAILAAVSAGTIADAPAASYCDGVEFVHGKKGYLPAAGEIILCYTYLTTINECMSAIGGTTFDMASKDYHTSTQCCIYDIWGWSFDNNTVLTFDIVYGDTYVRAVSAL